MQEKAVQRNPYLMGNQPKKPSTTTRPRPEKRPVITALGHRLGGIALCGLAATAMQPGEAQAQANIKVSMPEGTATSWSLNGTTYTGDTNSLNQNYGNDNSISFNVSPLPGNPASSFQAAISGLSTTLIPGTYTPTATSLEVTLSNGTAAAITNANFAFSSTGGQSTIDSLAYPNSGSNLDLTANGVGATVFLNDSSPIYEAYLVQSQGEIGLAATDFTSVGANGGQINATINPTQGLSTSILVAGQSYEQGPLSWVNPPAGIQASSIGGFGAAGSTGAGTDKFYDWSGDGGDGGAVNLTVGDITINLGLADDPLLTSPQAPVAGILATSEGGSVGPCCTWYDKQGSTITVESDPAQIQFPIDYGNNGDGGSVVVNFSGSISGDAANTFGIVATSVGGSTQLPPGLSDPGEPAGASGLGGDVTVNLTGADINLGPSSVGIFAGSLGAYVNIPSSMEVAGLANYLYPGTVTVSLDDNSSIFLGELPGSSLSAGIVAVSSTGWQFQPIGQQIQGSSSAGNGGVVTVSNAGSITSYAESTIGIAALSLGNGGTIANAPASTSTTNYISTTNQGAIQPASAESVTVTNTGSISIQGNASIGILAVSNGAGGLITGIPDAAFSSFAPNGNKIHIGTQGTGTGYVAGAENSTFQAPGGAVTVTNSGSITTESGNVAIGIIAQSVGGGGASYTEGVSLFVGDAGGQGGDGGPITLSNSGPISTAGDGSIGFLGQSIGGGGGHGSNTKGLFVAVGGQGGNGGAGGPITASLQSGSSPYTFSTSGDFASGMLLQSIGGGGGNGGYGKAYGIFLSTGIGGAGGSGGAGGDIAISTTDASALQTTTSGNQSHGLLLQSIGGGGGNGGHAYSYAAGAYFAGAVAVGGSGKVAGPGGSLNLCPAGGSSCSTLSGSITTTGYDSVGVLLQSIGGGGGYGGGAIAEAYAIGVEDDAAPPVTVSFAASVGGNGSAGGEGGAISMVSDLAVSTAGTGSYAIAAQSIGGGGGGAADSTAGSNSYDDTPKTYNMALSLGGTGGSGGNGGAIDLTTSPNFMPGPQLSTLGHNAAAILAQSIGGGGGYGGVGNSYSNDISVGDNQYGLSFALGGNSGEGSKGGNVTITNGSFDISTAGSQSPGVLAQSIGGGGGVAGNAGAQSAGGNLNVSIAVGGNAGSGSAAGTVTITNSANITTGVQLDLASNNQNNLNLSEPFVIGSDSPGIVAQSIGGGGGIGGNADPVASLISSVQSMLNDGAGDYVNSNGLKDYFKSADASAPLNYDGTLAIGGTGGSGGDGQAVSVTHQNSQITTFGHRSYGILAQSVGGGGGIGGSSMASSSFLTGSASATILTGYTRGLGINVGGQGGNGGSGGDVTVNIDAAAITTAGYGSHGILAQSIGGGGGAAHDGSVFGLSGSIGPTPDISVNPSITVGSVTKDAGMQGSGGNVTVQGLSEDPQSSPFWAEQLITLGDAASAVLMQSIGGGGGIAGYSCTNSGNPTILSGISITPNNFTASACFQNANSTNVASSASGVELVPASFQPNPEAQGFEVTIEAAVPSTGNPIGANSQGGSITYSNNNLALTLGNRSIGIVAQSIGGGGGYISAPALTITKATLPEKGVNNSPGGDVTVTMSGTALGNGPWGVITAGTGAWGILAQSIGGGGGFIGDPSFTLTEVPEANKGGGLLADAVANGGKISITLGNPGPFDITTHGAYSHGIVAQSIGGGGGITNASNQAPFLGSSAGSQPNYQGAGGQIDINIYSNIVVNSPTSMGVFAQSAGTTTTSGPISINLAGSILVSADPILKDITSTGAAIMLSGGSTDSSNPNSITVASGGLIGSTNAKPEHTIAIRSNYGYTNVTNSGIINGSIDLNGQGEINNTASGILNAGQKISVSKQSLHNHGLMRIGSLDTISQTDLQGRFVQHNTGTLELSIDSSADVKSDYLNISGPMILSGYVVPHTSALLRDEIEFASADSIQHDAKVPSNFLLYEWQLRNKDNKLTIKPSADFTPESVSLTSNQHSLATYLQRSWDQGEPSDASLFSYFHTFTRGDADNYTAALKQIGGMALNSQPIQMKTSFSTALSESLTCPTLTPEGLKPNQQSCVWARATGDYSTQSSNDNNSGYWVSAPGIRLGGQSDLGNGWTAGMVFGYGTNYLRSDSFSSNGDFFDVAVSARKQLGNWELGGSLAFAQGWFENSRNVHLQARGPAAAIGGEYSSNSSLSMLGLRLRAAYNYQSGVHQFKPYLDVDLSQAWMPAYRESSGDLSLQSKSSSDFNAAITPMLEYTLYSTGKGGSGFKAYLSAGASWLPDNRVSTPMSFRNDQLDNGTFNVVTDGPSLLGRLNVGAEAMVSENLEVRAEYNLQMGGGYRNQGISANLRYRF